jgi:hypothetical protein
MSTAIICYRNILESGTVTVTSENSAFPKAALYDRDIGFLFKGNTTPANFYITVDQGASISYEVDRLIIPAGHNLDGLALKLQYSTDNFGSDINDALSWTQSGSGLIDKTFTAQTKRYWRLNIASPASAPELAEMFLTKQIPFIYNPEFGGPVGKKRNIDRTESRAGEAQKVKNGDARRSYKYGWSILEAAEKDMLEAWDDDCEGTKNFYLIDTDGNTVFVERLGDLIFTPIGYQQYQTSFDLLEVVP